MVASVAASVKPAAAAQVRLVDETFQHQPSEGSHHHAKPSAMLPPNLAAPDDYRKGSLHIRVELRSTASSKVIRWLLTLAQGSAYVCVGPQKAMPGPGVYEWDVPLADFQCLHAPAYDNAKPPTLLSFIVRDSKGTKVDPGSAYDGAPNLGLYFPLEARVTVTLVSNGSTFIPEATPDEMAPDEMDPAEDDPPGEPKNPASGASEDSSRADAGSTRAAVRLPGVEPREGGCSASSRFVARSPFAAIAALVVVLSLAHRRRALHRS